MTTENDIVYENGMVCVCDDGDRYTVIVNGVTHAVSDSSYEKTPEGLSIAKARADYISNI